MTVPSRVDLERELARQRDEAEQARLGQFDPGVLSRLALLPEWTVELAAAAGVADRELVDRLDAAGLIERRETLGADGRRQEAFWVRSGARPGLVRHLRAVRGQQQLADDLQDLAGLVARVTRQRSADPGLLVWLDVVRRDLGDRTGSSLLSTVDQLVARDRLGDAASVVAVAQVVGEMVGGPLDGAARRAQWRLDLAHRTAEDAQHLRHYLRREEIEQAFGELLDPGAEQWALHLLGAGGVGKTMLVRYLASGRYAADRETPRFPVGRVDFDHLDPRYPQQRPAELLLALADELVGFAGTRGAYSSYRRFQDAAVALHEEMARATADASRQESLLDGVVAAFARFLADLPAPVLLVLDTCEELAKLYALGSNAPAIDRTFELLERLHERRPDLRVVLAGRRWLVPSPDAPRRVAGPLLRPRPYLRVLAVGGFSRHEALAYLQARSRARSAAEPGVGGLPDALRDALLDRSVQRRDGEDTWHNPFELAGYCEWAFSEPDLDPEELRTAPGDPYVERRIIGRLGDGPARDGLAVAAAFGRFNRGLAAPGWRRSGVDPDAAFDALAAQEWVFTLSVGADGRPRVVEIDEHLRDRIQHVTALSRASFPVDRHQLGRDAAAVIDRTPLGELPAETVEAAVHLLPPDEAGPWWQRTEDRIVADGEWAWAAQVVPRVAALALNRAEAHPGRPTILATILATQAATGIHTGLGQSARELWEDVHRAVDRYPEGEARAVLRARATLGRIAAGDPLVAATVPAEVPPGSVAAAVEGWLAHAPSLRDDLVPLTQGIFEQHADPALAALAGLALSTGFHYTGPAPSDADAVLHITDTAASDADAVVHITGTAASYTDAALADAERVGSESVLRWADWVPPRGLLDRCRLARLLIAQRANEPLDALPWPEWRADALARVDDIDAERLAALTIHFEFGHRPVDRGVVENAERADHYVAGRRATTWLHRDVPSLAVALADAWRVLGDPDHAHDLLSARREDAVAAGDDPETIEESDLALLRLCRRQRTTDYLLSIRRLAREGSTAVRAESWLVLTLVHGERPASPAEAGSWHGWWQCQDRRSLVLGPRFEPPPDGEPGVPAATSEASAQAYRWFFSQSDDPDDPYLWPEITRRYVPADGAPGALGRSVLATAEMLALAFPAPAGRLLARAGRQLDEAGDTPAATQAYLLAALAAARADLRADAELAWQAAQPLLDRHAHSSGWQLRIEAVQTYLQRRRTPAYSRGSPELDLTPASLRSVAHEALDIEMSHYRANRARDDAERTGQPVCGTCGHNNDPAAVFCANCGTFLGWAGEHPQPSSELRGSGPPSAAAPGRLPAQAYPAQLGGGSPPPRAAEPGSAAWGLDPDSGEPWPGSDLLAGAAEPHSPGALPGAVRRARRRTTWLIVLEILAAVVASMSSVLGLGAPLALGFASVAVLLLGLLLRLSVASGSVEPWPATSAPPVAHRAEYPATRPRLFPLRRRRRRVWLIVLGVLVAVVVAGVTIGLAANIRGAPPGATPTPTPTIAPTTASSPPSPTGSPTETHSPSPSTSPATSTSHRLPPSASSGPGLGALLALAVGSVAVAAVLLGLVAVGAATLRHGCRFRASCRIIVDRSSERVGLAAAVHRGLADLDGGWLTTLGCWLRRTGRPRRWAGWTATVSPVDDPVEIDLSGLRLPSGPGRRDLTVVQLDPTVQDHPWEQWLAGAGQPAMVFRREPGPPRPPPPGRSRQPEVTIHASVHLTAHRKGRARHGLLYLVGTPVPTAAGWRLRVTGATAASPTEGTSGRGTLDDEELLAVDHQTIGGRALVVLQAEPVDGPPQALDDQRAGFVGLARAELDAGAAAVLVVPPLPDELAGRVFEAVWRRVVVRRRRVRPSLIVVLLARLTDMIAEAGGTARPDLILFLRTALREEAR